MIRITKPISELQSKIHALKESKSDNLYLFIDGESSWFEVLSPEEANETNIDCYFVLCYFNVARSNVLEVIHWIYENLWNTDIKIRFRHY